MSETLRSSCELFIKNRDLFKEAFPWENAGFYPICAATYTDKGRLADVKALQNTRKLIKSRLSAFSNFRGASELPLIAMLSVCDDPEERLDGAIALYGELKDHFFSSEYLPVAAVILSGEVGRERYDEIAERTRRIYDLMKKDHPFLTSSEDAVFAAIFALSDKSDEELLDEAEAVYTNLKSKFSNRNALQSLSHVLAFADDCMRTAGDRCRDTARLYDMLKEKKQRYGTGYELATLGTLATLPGSLDETARDLIDASEFLKTQKGYGFWGSFGKQQRLMHAAMIVTSDRIGGSEASSGAAISGTISMIAAQHAATCAAISVSIAASSAANAAR